MQISLKTEERIQTFAILAFGLIAALILNASTYAVYALEDWPWVNFFPIRMLANYFGIALLYIHEFGHTILFWFYGYIAFPSPNFQHGGGVTIPLTGQLLLLHLTLYGFLGYAAYHMKGHLKWQMAMVAIGLFHLATAHFEIHEAFITAAGELNVIFAGGVFLTISMLNIERPFPFKRFLSAMFGFFLLVHSALVSYFLLFDKATRHAYYNANAQHGIGDFDRVAEYLYLDFSTVVCFFLGLIPVMVVLPVMIYFIVTTDDDAISIEQYLKDQAQSPTAAVPIPNDITGDRF